jgi:hypothetical protein
MRSKRGERQERIIFMGAIAGRRGAAISPSADQPSTSTMPTRRLEYDAPFGVLEMGRPSG